MSLLPDALAQDILNHLQLHDPSYPLDALGRLYSSSAPRPQELDRFMPSSVAYVFWLAPLGDTESSTRVDFSTGQERKMISFQLSSKMRDLLSQEINEYFKYEEQAVEHNKKIIVKGFVRISKSAKPVTAEPDAPIRVQVTIENRASYQLVQANTSLAEDEFPERTTSIYDFRIREELNRAEFLPDPRLRTRKRFFVTENIVNYSLNKERTAAEFRDYGQANETVERPSRVTRSVSESISDVFVGPEFATFCEPMARTLQARGITSLSEFQERALKEIAKALSAFLHGVSPQNAFLLNAPTAGGKTEAFVIPVLSYVWADKSTRGITGTKTLIFYPTKALADDQFQRLLFYVSFLNDSRQEDPISLGIFHGDIRSPRKRCTSPTCRGQLGVRPVEGRLEIYCTQCNRAYSPSQIASPKGKCPWCYEGFCPLCKSKLDKLFECAEHGVVESTSGLCEKCGKVLTASKNTMKCTTHGTIDLTNVGLSSEVVAKTDNPTSIRDVEFVLRHEKCGRSYPFVSFLRDQVFDKLPDIVITNPDIIHSYVTRVPGRRKQFEKWNFYEYQKVYRLLGMNCFYCPSCKWTFDNAIGECPLPHCDRKGQKAVPLASRLGFLVVDEIHMIRGNFGCNATGFFSNLLDTISKFSNIRPICISATATVKNERQPPAAIFGFELNSIVVVSPDSSTTEPIHERLHLFILPKGLNTITALREVLTALYVDRNSLNSFPRLPRPDRQALQALVFFDNKRNLYETATTLQSPTIGGAEIQYHTADVPRHVRRRREEEFSSGKIQVLLATSTLEVGVDFDFLKLLINFGVPFSYNSYLQRVGRAGRRGPALIVNILRYQVPLDNYYFENYDELITYSRENVDIVPIVRDIPLSVRRHVFAMAASMGVLSHTAYSARAFYNLHLENDPEFQEFVAQVENTFIRPPMVRENEVKQQLRNVSEYLREKLGDAPPDRRLNDALDDIARKDQTHRLDFSLRNNEIEVPVFIRTPDRFRASLRGSRSTAEDDVGIDEQESE